MLLNRLTTFAAVALGLTALSVGQAHCQGIGSGVGSTPPGPTVSPYINLLRSGNSAAANYYGLVRPQFQTNAGLQSLQQQVLSTQGRPLAGSELSEDVFVTGHAAVFMNYGGFFQSPLGGLGPVRPQLPVGPAAQAPGARTSARPAPQGR